MTAVRPGSSFPVVTPDSPLTSRPHDLLVRAVETHAAIAEGSAHEPTDVLAAAQGVTTPPVAAPRSRRAPRKRKAEQ